MQLNSYLSPKLWTKIPSVTTYKYSDEQPLLSGYAPSLTEARECVPKSARQV